MSAFDDTDCCFLTIPGWRNSGPNHWQTLWESELPNCSRVRQNDWEDPVPQHWTHALDEAVQACKRPVILIAHSLGCHAVARWASVRPPHVRAALLVAPPAFHHDGACSNIVRRFKEADQPLSFPSLLVGSENDPYASAAAAKDLANVWGSQFLNVGKAGHINVDSGHGPWPQGKALLSRLLERCRPREISASAKRVGKRELVSCMNTFD